jgi:hypothetical protein
MRRRAQRPLFHLVAFCIALSLLLYLNRTNSTDSTFAWKQIRYQTTSVALPESRGRYPGLSDSSKPALVVGRVEANGNPTWLDALRQKYHLCVYTNDAPFDRTSACLQVPANRGHEAMVYLTFLIDNYDHIPAAGAVFVHGSRWAWHNDALDYDNRKLLAALNISAALEQSGYHNLRCDWSASTCSPSEAPPQGSLEISLRAALQPYDARVVSDRALSPGLDALFRRIRTSNNPEPIVNDNRLPKSLGRGDAVRSQCCAQFVVARENIWQHSRDEYIAIRKWLLDGTADGENASLRLQSRNAAPSDDRVAGRILSYLWHILFIRHDDSLQGHSGGISLDKLNTLACPRADECYCRLYGRCNLPGCQSPGRCSGQYRIPDQFRLPDDWAVTHS